MAIKKILVWMVECDKGGKTFALGDCEYNGFETKMEAKNITENEGWQVKGKKVYCDKCRTY